MIHDYIKKSQMGRSSFPKLKGHLRIELKDVKTGRRDVAFEGDNMITDALKDIFASNYCGALDYRKLLPLYSKMLGGILCFGSNTLDVTSEGAAKDYFIPDESTHPVIAHAGQTESPYGQSDDVKRGHPLDTSMIVQDGAVTLAWEWGSAAGNGTFYSLGLTHSDVGDAGTGSSSQAFAAMKPVINAHYTDKSGYEDYGLPASNDTRIRFIKDGYAYSFWATTTTNLAIKKIPIAFKETGLVAGNPFIDMSASLIETHNIDVTDLGLSGTYQPYYFFDGNNTLWLLFNSETSRTFNYMTVNLTTWATSSGTVTTDSVAVGRLGGGSNETCVPIEILFDGTYMYLPRSGPQNGTANRAGLLKMKLPPNQADQTATGFSSTCKGQGGIFIPNGSHKILAADGLVINNGTMYPASSDSSWSSYYDVNNMPLMVFNDGLASLMLQAITNRYYYYVGVSKFYLGTKYNLPTPITKQNTQSMVVTYTLTEVS